MTLFKKFKPDGNLIYIITMYWFSIKMKLQYMNFTSTVALSHLIMVLFIENISKHVNVTKKLGQFGTGFPIAPALCFKPAVNRQPGFRRWDS